MALSAQTGYIVPQEYDIYHVGQGWGQEKHTLQPGLSGDDPLATLRLHQRSLFYPITWQVLTIFFGRPMETRPSLE